jgi:methyl-accepting chemotaxis protein
MERTARALPSGAEFRRRYVLLSLGLSAAATALIALYLTALMRMPASHWRTFGLLVLALFAVLFPLQDRVNRALWGPVAACLDRLRAGDGRPEDLREGFAAVVSLPVRGQLVGWLWWSLGGLIVGVGMKLVFDTFTWLSAFIMVSAAVSGGFVMTVFHFHLVKRLVEPLREALAQQLSDPVERGALVRTTSLHRKLVFSITGVTVFTVLFAIFCAQIRSMRPVEAHAVRVQSRFLEDVARNFEFYEESALPTARAEARQFGIADDVVLLDADMETVLEGDASLVLPGERELMRAAGEGRRDSTAFDSPHVLAWLPLPDDGRVLVAVSRWEPLMGEIWATRLVFAVLVGVAALLALGVGHLLASDVSRATQALRGEAERLAGGDLRRGRVFESEDELGELSRSFEAMSGSLRETVGRVSSAADRVEATAAEMAGVAASVSSVTADQVSGIRQTTSSMEAINGQVRGIADSAQALNVSVEESSSSILELGAAGEELNETASVLSERVNEVSSSIEEMVRSVKQVLENAEQLSQAAVETSSSMGEMATSMREVDASAEEAARLSREVVESAESGQQKMVETIEGMEAIREATETAERVIRSLGGRASEIGAIVDVIDDVADETNLLALNAAIIAAQAGEHGRAFSVVADEIKDLADRVLASTKEIGSQIRSVQEESTNAIGAIEQGTQSVAEGVDRTAEAGVSLEEITKASRESGRRIGGIVQAVREQARAASHVVELMERVREGVEEIQKAAAEQDRGNEVVFRGSVAMRDVATQVRGTTEEQARGSGRIRESIEGVREAVERINAALQEQSAACRQAVEFLAAVHERTRANEQSATRLGRVSQDLVQQAEALRSDVGRFRL